MTNAEILDELGTESLLNRVRRALTSFVVQTERRQSSATRCSTYELRRAEFDAAAKVITMVREQDVATAAEETK